MNRKLPVEPPERRRRRGRPPKFGRPARLVAVTLPTDVSITLEPRAIIVAGRRPVTKRDRRLPR